MRLLIDAQGIAWACAHRLKLDRGKGRKPRDLSANGQRTGAVYGVLRSLEHLMIELEPEEMIVCWDRRCHRRYELYPDYKLHRQPENLKTDEEREFRIDVERQIDELRHLLTYLPVIQIEEPGAEADDCIGILSAFLKHETVGIVTKDHDLYQLATKRGVKPRHVIFNPDGTPAELAFKPKQYLIYKALVGDASDHIKGVLGVGDKTTRKLIREYGTLKKIMRAAKKAGKFGRNTYEEAEEIVKRNLQLMIPGILHTENERKVVLNRYKLDRLNRHMTSAGELRKAFTHYKFTSLISRLSSFMMHFSPLIRTRHDRQEPSPKRWEPLHPDHPARASRSVRQENNNMRHTRIVKRTVPRRSSRAGHRRTGYTRIIRRTVSDSDGGPEPALLVDARWSDDDGSVTAVPADSGKERRTRRQAAKVGAGRAGKLHPKRISKEKHKRKGKADRIRQATDDEQSRNIDTIMRLRSLARDHGWPEAQTVKTLNFVRMLIRRYEDDPGFIPTTQASAWVRELHDEWTFAMPAWAGVPSDNEKAF